MRSGNTEIRVELGDITQCEVDAIVNAANRFLRGGGGVDGAIHRAAGPKLHEICMTLGGCETGQAKITPGFNLPAKYVIHTPGPIWSANHAEECDALLRSCYCRSLELAEEYVCQTVAFSSISTGLYHFPLARAAEVVARAFFDFFWARQTSCVRVVTMIGFDARTCDAYYKAFSAILK